VLPQFSITVRPGSVVHVVVEGELDLATAPRLGEALRAEMARSAPVLLDLSGVSFTDSTGIATIVTALNEAKENGWDLGVAPGLSHQVKKVLELTDVLPMLPIVEGS
jgi:anti-sigma B factor antagonist